MLRDVPDSIANRRSTASEPRDPQLTSVLPSTASARSAPGCPSGAERADDARKTDSQNTPGTLAQAGHMLPKRLRFAKARFRTRPHGASMQTHRDSSFKVPSESSRISWATKPRGGLEPPRVHDTDAEAIDHPDLSARPAELPPQTRGLRPRYRELAPVFQLNLDALDLPRKRPFHQAAGSHIPAKPRTLAVGDLDREDLVGSVEECRARLAWKRRSRDQKNTPAASQVAKTLHRAMHPVHARVPYSTFHHIGHFPYRRLSRSAMEWMAGSG